MSRLWGDAAALADRPSSRTHFKLASCEVTSELVMFNDHSYFHIGDVLAKEVNRNYLYFVLYVNATAMDEQRRVARIGGGPVPSYTAFAVHAIGNALRDHPELNCMIREL